MFKIKQTAFYIPVYWYSRKQSVFDNMSVLISIQADNYLVFTVYSKVAVTTCIVLHVLIALCNRSIASSNNPREQAIFMRIYP